MSKKWVKCRDGHESVVMGYKTMCAKCGAPFVEEEITPDCKHHGIPMKRALAMDSYDGKVGATIKVFDGFECSVCLKFVKRWLDEHGLKAMEVL